MDIIKPTIFTFPEQDEYISALEQELSDSAILQGKQNGIQNKPVTESEQRAFIMNSVENKVQAAIHKTEELFKPISGMTVAHSIKQQAEENVKILQAEYNQDEHTLVKLEEAKKLCAPDLSKKRIRRLIHFGTAVIAATDGYFAYESLRYASFTLMAALVSATGIAFAIGLIIHVMGGYIAKSKSRLHFRIYLMLTLIPAFIGFFVLGTMRAHGYNEAANLDISNELDTINQESNISPISLTIISFLLFTVALVFSIRYARTEEERKKEQEYDVVATKIEELKKKMETTQATITNIKEDASRKQAEALATFEYALSVENRLQVIAKKTMNIFAENNLRHRTDGIVPTFFSHPPAFQFKLFFENIKNSRA